MLTIVLALLRYLLSWLRAHHELGLENVALWHQIQVLKRQRPKPRVIGKDRFLWVVLKQAWPNWRSALMLFQPETVIGWQRAGFRVFWRWKSRHGRGRPGKDPELVQLIRRMWAVNPTWGSPRIRDELAKLGLKPRPLPFGSIGPSPAADPAKAGGLFCATMRAPLPPWTSL